jgi:hypothetical protein
MALWSGLINREMIVLDQKMSDFLSTSATIILQGRNLLLEIDKLTDIKLIDQ